MSIEVAISLLATIGLGGILGAYFQSRFQHQKEVKEDIHQLKRERYGAILIQMLTILDPEHLHKTQRFRPDLKNIDDVKVEVRTEMLNSIVFASDEVIKAMSGFVKSPSDATYIKAASAMRKDLWGKDTKIGEDILKTFGKGEF